MLNNQNSRVIVRWNAFQYLHHHRRTSRGRPNTNNFWRIWLNQRDGFNMRRKLFYPSLYVSHNLCLRYRLQLFNKHITDAAPGVAWQHGRFLHHVNRTGSKSIKRRKNPLFIYHRRKNQYGCWTVRHNMFRCFKTIHHRHINIHNNDIRL